MRNPSEIAMTAAGIVLAFFLLPVLGSLLWMGLVLVFLGILVAPVVSFVVGFLAAFKK